MSSATRTSSPSTVFTYDSPPNAAKLMDSLRYLNYSDISACLDISDNSLDANATHLSFTIEGEKKARHTYINRILIADDGDGMDRETLGQALRLGSDTPHDVTIDLGKFGMGLCTASLSVCRRTTVLTKTSDGEMLKGINDVDVVKRENRFVSFLGDCGSEDEKIFSDLLGDSTSGTVVIFEKIDGLQYNTVTGFCNRLKHDLGRVYRYFISAGKSFSVNGENVEAIDPLEWESDDTEHFDDSQLEIKFTSEDGTPASDLVRVRIAVVAENPAEGEKAEKRNMQNQGIYVVRNNREILHADTLGGMFQRHNYLNRFRCELRISGNLDKVMNVGVKKHGVNPEQSVRDQIQSHLKGQISTIMNRIKRAKRADVPDEIDAIHKAAEQEIQKKSKLLKRPPAPRTPRTNSPGPKSPRKKTDGPSHTDQARKRNGLADRVRFETMSMGESGPIFEAEQEGPTVIVNWNSDHPFYKRFVLDNVSDRKVVAGVDYLLYCWAAAELEYRDNGDEVEELLINIKSDMSKNLRVLLR